MSVSQPFQAFQKCFLYNADYICTYSVEEGERERFKIRFPRIYYEFRLTP